jgi:GTPase SAR1 family protein
VALIVYDLSDPRSIEELVYWMRQLRENGPSEISVIAALMIVTVLVGNKKDQEVAIDRTVIENAAQRN